MDDSIYTPGAGMLPPILAGRDALLGRLMLGLNAVATRGRLRSTDVILVGPRGVGKTAAMSAYAKLARGRGFEVVNLQAVAGHAGVIESLLQHAKSRIAREAGPWRRARSAFERVSGVGIGLAGVSASMQTREAVPVATTLDPGALAETLSTLAGEVRHDRPSGGLLVTVDEMQVASSADLALLAATLHRLNVDHPGAAVTFAGTGLAHTAQALRHSGVTHPDRLFGIEQIPVSLDPIDALYAIVEPANRVGVVWQPDAADAVVAASNGYPAHLQLFADAVWSHATGPHTITSGDVARGLPYAEADLARRTLGPRWERMSDREMEYLAALALAGGRTTARTMARILERPLSDLSWIRQQLLREGDVYSPARGHIALAVPLFARFIMTYYEAAREQAEIPLLHLERMRASIDKPDHSEAMPRPLPSPDSAT